MIELADQAGRERIRADLGSTLLVEAAAGTGKTTELVARIVALVRSGTAQLDRVLAVTFTELAAGEMKLRLRGELEKARASAPAAERARFDDALGKLEVAAIGTIHAFCSDLLRERPVEARVDPVFEVAADEQRERLFDQAFETWFARTVASPPEGVRRVLRRKPGRNGTPPREELRRAGLELAEHRDFAGAYRRVAFDRRGALSAAFDRLAAVGDLARRAARREDWCAKSIGELDRFVAELRRRSETETDFVDALEAELREVARRPLWKWRGTGKYFAPDLLRETVLAERDAAKAGIEAAIAECDQDLAAALREELRPLCDEYERLKSRAGCLDFLDLLLEARNLLRGDALVRSEMQQRYTHLLVDEFQDTDPLQAEILLLLAADDPAESDWRRARPLPGKLFVVGDPKQSIYRFRRADIALYQQVKEQLLAAGAELVHLTTSFRSAPALQQAVNAAFAPRMTGGGQAEYVPLTPFRGGAEGRPAVVALPAPRIYGKGDRIANWVIEESYPQAVGAFIEWLVNESGWTVTERDKAEPVKVAARHVCLLFRRFRGWDGDLTRPYVSALEARRIPHVLVGGRSYHDREEVLALRACARAIEWPDDELSVFAALKGPLFSLGDDALLVFHERQRHLHPLRKTGEALSTQEQEVLAALGVLRELHQERNRRPIAETLSRLLDATRAHAGVAMSTTGEQSLANTLRVLELARRFEAAGASSFRAFVDRLDDEAERGEAPEAPVLEEGTEGVRMMSVHKAKGLEFPVVILCDPCAAAVPKTASRFVQGDVWAMPLAGCAPRDLVEQGPAVLQRDAEEIVRLAYVAATRARDLLVVPVTGDEEPKSWLEPLNLALYPAPAERRRPVPAPGCPPFGRETVLDRPELSLLPPSVSPGLHRPQAGAHSGVWWDPHVLDLGRDADGGVRSHDLLVDDARSHALAAATARAHAEWQATRARATATGSEPSLSVRSATEASFEVAGATGSSPATPAASPPATSPVAAPANVTRPAPEAAPSGETPALPAEPVPVERVERDPSRPRGKRFGSLVHALLAASGEAPLEAVAAQEGRLAGAPDEEVRAALDAARRALEHPVLRRAQASADVRREEALLLRLPDGSVVEGVADLAFREDAGWVVVDFKTDARPEDHPHYAAQLRLYCEAITAATGLPARPLLLAV